jgi:hypothetical protein
VQLPPVALHCCGPLQRLLPSTSWSQWFEQQSVSAEQVSPVRTHDPAGTSHLPFTQLSVQQSVLRVQVWWNDRQVRQLTPTMQALPEQQPFAHEAAVHWQLPPTQT